MASGELAARPDAENRRRVAAPDAARATLQRTLNQIAGNVLKLDANQPARANRGRGRFVGAGQVTSAGDAPMGNPQPSLRSGPPPCVVARRGGRFTD